MTVARHIGPPPDNQTDQRVALSRPEGAGTPLYGEIAAQLLDNGYEPIPIAPSSKRPVVSGWTSARVDTALVDCWASEYPDFGVGLRTGQLVGFDIDLLDPGLAHDVFSKAEQALGSTLMRVGLWPKRLLLYRTQVPFGKLGLPKIDVLGQGQQFVAFGRHPETRRAYTWPNGETPLEVALSDLPLVSEDQVRRLLGELAAVLPKGPIANRRGPGALPGSNKLERNTEGLVVDGRDFWLSTVAFHVVHDALDAGQDLDVHRLARLAWDRFAGTTDLARARKGSDRLYGEDDALKKVLDKLRLHSRGELKARRIEVAELPLRVPELSVEAARAALDVALQSACDRIEAWHQPHHTGDCPQIGIRATVGLGKSSATRRHLRAMHDRLAAMGAPRRIAVFTPSHALANEAAADWRGSGLRVAVLRGYESIHPERQQPMCRDLEAVRLALGAGLDISESACHDKAGHSCRYIHDCLKQQNRREVADAEIIIAPYDALFTGFAADTTDIGVIVVDEGCWARAVTEDRNLKVELLTEQPLLNPEAWASKVTKTGRAADLLVLRQRLATALRSAGPGVVYRSALVAAGLTADDCRHAAGLEYQRREQPVLYPGMPRSERAKAAILAADNRIATRLGGLFNAAAQIISGADLRGQVRVLPPDPQTGLHDILMTGLATIHPNLRGKPVLHLDATMRPEIAGRLFPGLEVTSIEVAAPHMHVRLVAGRFGKAALIEDGRQNPEENARRRRHLAEVVDYVRWQALRVAPGRSLVITYQSCEAAFADIPGVETAHYNAIAGIDAWRDVAQIILVGRPLPGTEDLAHLCGGLLGTELSGSYGFDVRAVRLRDGSHRAIRALVHSEPNGELLRAAICDDELIQAVGRGRGVNRTADTPLKVHVLADVALPIVHDEVTAWDLVAPSLFQKMLLAGVAVDSPADAATLHPQLFSSAKQAQKALEREGFGRHSSYRDSIREMSLKSARYRRSGRGRSWQTVWWFPTAMSDDAARDHLAAILGGLAEWQSE